MSNINLALTESQSLRNQHVSEINSIQAIKALEKAKALIWTAIDSGSVATIKQCAEYYEVHEDAIEACIRRNRNELKSDGLIVLGKKQLGSLSVKMTESQNTARLTVLTPRAFLRIGLLLRDSLVAQEVRQVLIDISLKKVSCVNDIFSKSDIKDYSKNLSGFIYLVNIENTNLFKIGKSKEVYNRVSSLQTSSPYKLNLIHRYFSLDATHLEKMLHEYYQSHSIRGEWFNFSGSIIDSFMNTVSKLDLATEKAIAANLSDRKPVNTDSRTQKDQLLWSEDVIVVLSEHTENK